MHLNYRNNLLLAVLSLSIAIMAANDAVAIEYTSKETFIKQNIPKKSSLKERTIYLDNKEKQRITDRLNISEVPDSVLFIIGINGEGTLTGAVCFLKVYGEDISAVAGATESSRTVLRAVKIIVALFLEFIKEK